MYMCVCVCVCVYNASYILYPFISWWTLRLFQYIGYCNNAAVNMGVQIPLWNNILISFIVESYGDSIFNFLGAQIVFSIMAAPISSPTNGTQRFLPPHILTSIYLLSF